MEAITKTTGTALPLDRVNVDTDQIIPAVFLKRIERTGYDDALFASWRFNEDGSPKQDFILNQEGYTDSTVLLAGRNFGCGSSREHAPWALLDYGFRVVIAPSFADIFHKNCFDNGIVPAHLPEDQVQQLMQKALNRPGYKLTVDLETCTISDGEGLSFTFVVHNDPGTHEFRRHCLMNGLDDIALTLRHEDKISAFEARHTIT